MNQYAMRIGIVVLLVVQLLACATTTSETTTVSAGHLYERGYLNIHAPNSSGWYLLNSSMSRMEFSKKGDKPQETFAAQVILFPLKKTNHPEELVALIKQGFQDDTEPGRFDIINADFTYSDDRVYPCVVVNSVIKDKQARTTSGNKEPLLLTAKALYCRHPLHQKMGFAIMYSHRGTSEYPKLEVEADDFINSVQVPGY